MKLSLSNLASTYLDKFITSKPNLENAKMFEQLLADVEVFREGFSDERWSEYISKKYIEEQLDFMIQIKSLLEA